MKVTRLSTPKRTKDSERLVQSKTKHHPILRHPEPKSQVAYTSFMEGLNQVGNFTYMDVNRNRGYINLIKTQVNKLISNFGCDLQYFRKYNTFFQDDKQNKSNLIYGEDTTAEYYASGLIRSFVSVENMAWAFNQLGYENTEQVNIIISIDNFSQIFAKNISKIETQYFEIPITGNTVFNEVSGSIEDDHFNATIYGTFDNDLYVKKTKIKMIKKRVNDAFYVSDNYNSELYAITGNLEGQMEFDDCLPNLVSGILKGELTYHNFENIENSETWDLAPQVGDYFKFVTDTGLNEEWEITQVFDRILTNKGGGLNPLLGKYIYQCSAVKRQSSQENNTEQLEGAGKYNPGYDIDELFSNQTISDKNKYADQFTEIHGKNKFNKKTNRLAVNAYDYQDQSDTTYGGYQNEPEKEI